MHGDVAMVSAGSLDRMEKKADAGRVATISILYGIGAVNL